MGQSGSALGASAGQDLAAVGGSHSLSEPMDFASLSLFGLISSEHRSFPSFRVLAAAPAREPA